MKLEKTTLIGDLTRWANAYFDNLEAKNYSNNTLTLYKRSIDNFIEYMRQYEGDMSIKNIKTLNFTGYLAFLDKNSKNKQKLSFTAKQAYLKGVFGLFNFISENNDDFFDYERIIKGAKIKKVEHKEDKIDYLDEVEFKRLNDWLRDEKQSLDKKTAKKRLLIKLMLFSGLRISEALNLHFEDFDYSLGDQIFIRITGKGGYSQKVPVSINLIRREVDILEKDKNKDDFIFTTSTGARLLRTSAYLELNRLYARLGIKKSGCHILRHTMAMNMIKKGVEITTIQKVLRHSSLKETQIYAKATAKDVSEAVEMISNTKDF